VKLTVHLYSAQQAVPALRAMFEQIKPWLVAGHRLRVAVEQEKRSLSQNDHFHKICEELAKAKVPWFNKPHSKDAWKALLVSGHAVATKQGGEVIPGLEGEFVAIRESTASMTKARGSSLIEYSLAFAHGHGLMLDAGAENVAEAR
jgi:hypothetical protein